MLINDSHLLRYAHVRGTKVMFIRKFVTCLARCLLVSSSLCLNMESCSGEFSIAQHDSDNELRCSVRAFP